MNNHGKFDAQFVWKVIHKLDEVLGLLSVIILYVFGNLIIKVDVEVIFILNISEGVHLFF